MPTVDKASLREEFDACRERFRVLCRQGKVGPECEVPFDGLRKMIVMINALLRDRREWTPATPSRAACG